MTFLKQLFASPSPPLIPLPTDPPTQIPLPQLQKAYSEWLIRSNKLQIKLRALESATISQKTSCWVGPIEIRSEVRRVLAEARWIVKKLELAITWCDKKILAKQVGKNSNGDAIFLECPPSLCEDGKYLVPLPIAPGSRDYELLLPFFFERSDLPPTYHEELDVEHGEMSIGGGGIVEMGRRMVRAITGS